MRIAGMMVVAVFLYLLVALESYPSSGFPQAKKDLLGVDESPLVRVRAILNEEVLLPCDITPKRMVDAPSLVLFFKEGQRTPIFSADARSSSIYEAQTWADEDVLGTRATLRLHMKPQGLVLERVKLKDEGNFLCRVDYKLSPTRNFKVSLDVIAPPRHLVITASWRKPQVVSGLIGPYPEGADLTLACQVTGGVPLPQLSWWDENSLLDGESEMISESLTRNSFRIARLTRADLLRRITCQASNSNLSVPLSDSVTIDLAFPPTSVRISLKEAAHRTKESTSSDGRTSGLNVLTVSSGKSSPILCEAEGSRPRASLTWLKNGRVLQDAPPQKKGGYFLTEDLSSTSLEFTPTTRATLSLRPEADDNGALLACSASNPLLSNETIEDVVRLNVLYKPRLSIEAGHDIDVDDVEELQDVYFQCKVNSNPPVFEIQWAHNGVPLAHNMSSGVLVNDGSIVLRGVTRSSSGSYTCAAANSQGATTSRSLILKVRYPPVCGEKIPQTYRASRKEELNITCTVESHPPPTVFRWRFNSSTEVTDISQSSYGHRGHVSWLLYTPVTHMDFGTLLCWAANDAGPMRAMCAIEIIPATRPEPVQNCIAVQNVSLHPLSVMVSCTGGWDGGLPQTYTLEVRQARYTNARDLKDLLHSPIPEFIIKNLTAGEDYLFTVTASNSRGTSIPVTISYKMLLRTNANTGPYSQEGEDYQFFSIPSFFTLLLVTMLVMLLCVGTSAALIKVKLSRSRDGAKILYVGPIRGVQAQQDGSSTLQTTGEKGEYLKDQLTCLEEDIKIISDLKVESALYREQQEYLNNISQLALERTSLLSCSPYQPGLYNGHAAGRAPLASTESVGQLSGLSSNSRTMSTKSSISTVALNPEFVYRPEVDLDTSLTPLMSSLHRESSV